MPAPGPPDGHGFQHPRVLNVFSVLNRALIVALLALFTLSVVFTLQSALWTDGASLWMRAFLVGVAVLTLARPRDGLLVVAGLAPLAQVGARLLESDFRGPEALVLACLAGALLRFLWSGRARQFPADRTETFVLIFGLVVAASSIEQLWFLQAQRNFPGPFLQDLAYYLWHDYLVSLRGYGMVFNAMLLLEGLALLVWARRSCRQDPAFSGRLSLLLVASAVAAAALSISYATTKFLSTGLPFEQFWRFVLLQRWTVHVGDPNAAASFFVLALFIALGAAVAARGFPRLGWSAAALVTGAGLWMTWSRTAIIAALVVASVTGAYAIIWRSPRRLRALSLSIGATLLLWMGVYRMLPSALSETAGEATDIRWWFLQTTIRMVQSAPAFGVGIGQYSLWSQHFAPRELLAFYQSENAHNNFAQVAGELGLVGLAAFLLVLGSSLWRGRQRGPTDATTRASLAGLAAFFVTWLGGHPLLQPAVSYPFWIVLGSIGGASMLAAQPTIRTDADIAPEHRASETPFLRRPELAIGLVVALLALSMPARIAAKIGGIDWTRVSYGFYDWEKADGVAYRWTGPAARLFVSSDATRITIPIRAHPETASKGLTVDVLVNDRLADRLNVTDSAWHRVDIPLARRPTLPYQQIDIRPSLTWIPAEVIRDSPDSRVLGVQVATPQISKEAQQAQLP